MKADRDFTRAESQQPGLRHLISGDFFLHENKNDFFLKRFMSEINIFKFGHAERFFKTPRRAIIGSGTFMNTYLNVRDNTCIHSEIVF